MQAVIYKGPFKEVLDDEQHRFQRGRRHAVCDKTFQLLRQSPYGEHFEFIEPRVPIALEAARPFQSDDMRRRHPQETKGEEPRASSPGSQCCESGGCC
jgi:hypothetical protein